MVTLSSSFLLLFLQAKQSLATLTKDVPKRHSLAMPGETVLNGNQEWVVQADLPLTAAIRQSQQTLYHSHPPHPADRQGESCPAWASNKGGITGGGHWAQWDKQILCSHHSSLGQHRTNCGDYSN